MSRVELDQNENVEVKKKSVMRDEQINGLKINHSPTPLLEQKQMWVLNAKEMDSSSKIILRDVL
jgi:hypothetical protein